MHHSRHAQETRDSKAKCHMTSCSRTKLLKPPILTNLSLSPSLLVDCYVLYIDILRPRIMSSSNQGQQHDDRNPSVKAEEARPAKKPKTGPKVKIILGEPGEQVLMDLQVMAARSKCFKHLLLEGDDAYDEEKQVVVWRDVPRATFETAMKVYDADFIFESMNITSQNMETIEKELCNLLDLIILVLPFLDEYKFESGLKLVAGKIFKFCFDHWAAPLIADNTKWLLAIKVSLLIGNTVKYQDVRPYFIAWFEEHKHRGAAFGFIISAADHCHFIQNVCNIEELLETDMVVAILSTKGKEWWRPWKGKDGKEHVLNEQMISRLIPLVRAFPDQLIPEGLVESDIASDKLFVKYVMGNFQALRLEQEKLEASANVVVVDESYAAN